MTDVFFEILTPEPLDRREDGAALFKLWFDIAPGFFPDRAGAYEPLRHKITPDTVDACLDDWQLGYFTKRVSQPKSTSSILMQYGPHRRHGTWKINIKDHRKFDQPAFDNLMRECISRFRVHFGFIHIPTLIDIERGRLDGTVVFLDPGKKKINLFVPIIKIIKDFVPNLYFMTVFGDHYINLFTREKLLATPAYKALSLPTGEISIQLTANVLDCVTDEVKFEKKRRTAREFLNSNVFFDTENNLEHSYNIPAFE